MKSRDFSLLACAIFFLGCNPSLDQPSQSGDGSGKSAVKSNQKSADKSDRDEVIIRGPGATDEALARLAVTRATLTSITLIDAEVTPKGLAQLKKLPHLRDYQHLGGPPFITDEHVKALGQLPTLRRVFIKAQRITPKGIEHFKQLKNLRQLTMTALLLRPNDLAPLAELSNLEVLDLGKYRFVSDDDLSQLQTLFPKVKIQINDD